MGDKVDIAIDSCLLAREQLVEKILAEEYLVIAADEDLLAGLPSGNWIAGTIPYFMAEEGGISDKTRAFVHCIRGVSTHLMPVLSLYDIHNIATIAQEAPSQGFTVVILPAMSEVHAFYAKNAPAFANMYFSPIIGWVSGVHLNELGTRHAKVGFGPTGGVLSEQHAVAIHVPLPSHQVASINIVNLFDQGVGPEIKFPTTGFEVDTCLVDGQTVNFADYIRDNRIDTRLPLVANYSGVMINVSVQKVLDDHVALYAPVFADIGYRFAYPLGNYVESFEQSLSAASTENIAFSCNCILNYLHSDLEGKKTRDLTGPITFGEVAYQLLNQTLVYLNITTQR